MAGDLSILMPVFNEQAKPVEAGKKVTAFDGIRVLRTLVRCRLM